MVGDKFVSFLTFWRASRDDLQLEFGDRNVKNEDVKSVLSFV